MTVLIDSYSETNQDNAPAFIDEHPSDIMGYSAAGQCLTLSSAYKITSVKYYLKKSNSPTGNLVAKIYNTTGTVGTDAIPTGSALTESAPINSSTLTAGYVLYTFHFYGANQIIVPKGDIYIDVEANTADFSAANDARVGVDTSAPTHSGNVCLYANSAWELVATWDLIFYLYGIKIYTKLFNDIVNRFQRTYDMSCNVTLYGLTLGSQNATTGWHALTYTDTYTIEMPILPKSEAFSVHSIGAYARYEYIGFTLSSLKLYDKIVNAADQTFRVLSVTDYWVGDRFAYNVVGLEKLTEFD